MFSLLDIPEQPQSLALAAVTSTTVNMTWMESDSNNAPILRYQVTYMEPEFVDGDRNRVINTTELMAAITELSPGVNYSFTVRAFYEIGASAPSVALVVQTLDEGKMANDNEYNDIHRLIL